MPEDLPNQVIAADLRHQMMGGFRSLSEDGFLKSKYVESLSPSDDSIDWNQSMRGPESEKMGEKRAKYGRSGYRLRLAGTAGGVGAAAIVAIMALSAVASAGVATPGVFKGAVWSPLLYKDVSGCAKASTAPPHWSKLTGDGKM